METTLILNANIVNEGKVFEGDVLIKGRFIEEIGKDLSSRPAQKIIDARGRHLLPGAIDDQVHFREPGLTHKATIFSESRAAVAGGVTSFMEMPNTNPPTFNLRLLEDKFMIAERDSLANFSFFMGASNDNLEEVMKVDVRNVCGLKIFMGSSTGNLLVDDEKILEGFFSRFSSVIATHCEDEQTIRENTEKAKLKYGDNIPMHMHPHIRSEEACYRSSSFAVSLAKKYGTRLHILHISTARETSLFSNEPLQSKKITAEACLHHLTFEDKDYERLGSLIKWNPAIKTAADRESILKALIEGRIDVVATDHAPHTLAEKDNSYLKCPSGGPLVQHGVVAMLELYHQGKITLEKIAEKMAHNPAIVFSVARRGFIREGFYADLILVDLNSKWTVDQQNIKYKCGWSPFMGYQFRSAVTDTFVSGHHAYADGKFNENARGQRLTFERN